MKELDTAQVEQLKTIGDYLSQAREEQGVSLDEIAVKTYIPLRLLQALELGHVERLPEPVFVQGFIRRYADAIGLDGVAIAKTFSPQPSFMVERKAVEPERPGLQPEQPQAVERPVTARPVAEPLYVPPVAAQSKRRTAGRSYLPFVLLGATVVLLGAGLVQILNRSPAATESQAPETTVAQPSTSASTAQTGVPSTQAPNPSPTQSGGSPTQGATDGAAAPIQVAINLTAESWFKVVADDKVEFEGSLEKGEQKTWTAKKKLVLTAGNAGAVSVSYNQGEAKPMGKLGDVQEVTFPAATAKPASAN